MSIGIEDHNGFSGKSEWDTEGDSVAGSYIGVGVSVNEASPRAESGSGAGKGRDRGRSGRASKGETREP